MRPAKVPLADRAVLTLTELAAVVGMSKGAVYSRFDKAAGLVVLPGGSTVTVWVDPVSAQRRVYRAAVDAALSGELGRYKQALEDIASLGAGDSAVIAEKALAGRPS